MKVWLLLAASLSLLGRTACAQQSRPQRPAITLRACSAGCGAATAYTLQYVEQIQHASGPGLVLHATLVQDSERRERWQREVPDESSAAPRTAVLILDPVAGVEWTLDPAARTARRRSMAGLNPILAPPQNYNLLFPPGFYGGPGGQQQLGTRSIAAHAAQGSRETFLDAAGTEVASREEWSVQGFVGIWHLQAGWSTRAGDGYSFRVTRLDAGDPDPALFTVPANYTVIEVGPTPQAVAALFAEARAALDALPPWMAIFESFNLSDAEMRTLTADKGWQAQALGDAVAAFQRAVAVSLPEPARSNPAVAESYRRQKQDLESKFLKAVLYSPAGDSLSRAVEMARIADARHGPLYSLIISHLIGDPRLAAAQLDPVALAQECLVADGSFPYEGATDRGAIPPRLLGLVTLALRTAAAERAQPGIAEAERFLLDVGASGEGAVATVSQAGLAALWSNAAAALLSADPAGRFSRPLYEHLRGLDPERAAEALAELPALAGTLALARPRATAPAPAPPLRAPSQRMSAAVLQTQPSRSFDDLLKLAQETAATDPLASQRAALAASRVLENHRADPSFSPRTPAALGQILDGLGCHDAALQALAQALDLDTARARAAQVRFAALPAAVRASY
ncbi:MAG: hypothetical protein ACRD1E_11745, partial [Terriglobales bacterium]